MAAVARAPVPPTAISPRLYTVVAAVVIAAVPMAAIAKETVALEVIAIVSVISSHAIIGAVTRAVAA